jgi:hypothetical protein
LNPSSQLRWAKLQAACGSRRAIYAVAADGQASLAVDDGHYSVKGSIFAARTILAPVIDAELARLGKN